MTSEMQVLEDIKTYMPQFTVSLKDIQRPTSEFVIGYWLEALKQFGVNIERFIQPTIIECTALKADEHMMFVMKLYKVLRLIFYKVGTDFTIIDLLQPNPSRFWAHVGTMRNFFFFHVMIAEKLNELKHCALNVKENYKKTLITLNELKEKCNQKARDLVEKPVYLQKLKTEIEASSKRLIKLKEKINELHVAAGEHKDHLIEVDEKIISLKNESQKKEEQILQLRQQLVSSPEHVVQNWKELEAKEKNLKEQCSLMNEGTLKARENIMKLEKHIININTGIVELENCLTVLKDNSALKKKIDVSKHAAEMREGKLFSLNDSLSVVKAEIEQLIEGMSECQKAKLVIMTTSQQRVEDLNMALQNLNVETEKYANGWENIELEELRTSLEQQEVKLSQLHTDDAFLISKYEQLLKELNAINILEE